MNKITYRVDAVIYDCNQNKRHSNLECSMYKGSNDTKKIIFKVSLNIDAFINFLVEALKSVMRDVIRIRLKRKIATRSWKENQPLNIKTAVKLPI